MIGRDFQFYLCPSAPYTLSKNDNFTKIFMVLILVVFIYVFFSFFQNIDAPDGIKNAFLLMTAVIPLMGIAYTLQSSAYTFTKNFTFVLFYDQKKRQLSGGEGNNPYSNNYFDMFLELKFEDLAINDPFESHAKPQMVDIIEHGIVWALTMEFGSEWDYQRVVQDNPQGKSIQYLPGSVRKGRHLSPEDVRLLFSHNQILKDNNRYQSFGFYLPPNAEISIDSKIPRTIVIKNNRTILQIVIRPTYSAPFQKGIQGIFSKDPENMNRYVALYYNVEIKGEFTNWWPISWQEREAIARWHENVGKSLEKFNWENVRQEIANDLNQKANELIIQAVPELLSISERRSDSSGSNEYPSTPDGVVKLFTQLDAEGKRLRSKTQKEILYLSSSTDSSAGSIIIIDDYRIGQASVQNSTAVVPVEYEELLGLTAEDNFFNVQTGKRIIHFRLSRNDVWKIDGVLTAPHVHWKAAIAYFKWRQEIEPDRRNQLESVIQKITATIEKKKN